MLILIYLIIIEKFLPKKIIYMNHKSKELRNKKSKSSKKSPKKVLLRFPSLLLFEDLDGCGEAIKEPGHT